MGVFKLNLSWFSFNLKGINWQAFEFGYVWLDATLEK